MATMNYNEEMTFVEGKTFTLSEFMQMNNVSKLSFRKKKSTGTIFFSFGPRMDQLSYVSKKLQSPEGLKRIKDSAVISRVSFFSKDTGEELRQAWLIHEQGTSEDIETNKEFDITL